MNLYFYDGEKLSGDASEKMAVECVKAYIAEHGEPDRPLLYAETGTSGPGHGKPAKKSKWQVVRGAHGKPELPNVALEYNVSHSGILWVCIVGEEPVGIDIQEVRPADYEKIADRFFTKDELHYVELWGEDGFFDIWVRKEAYVKYLGAGFAGEGFSGFSVLDEAGNLKDVIGQIGKEARVLVPDMGFDIKCAICIGKESEAQASDIELCAIG